MTVTFAVLDDARSDVGPAAFRGRPTPPDSPIWAPDDHSAVTRDLLTPLGRVLVHATRIHPGQRVLDVAGGAGTPAIPASLRGVFVDRAVGDPEALPYASQSFDTVVSCLGVTFAAHHQTAANELVRVAKLRGRIGLVSWTPEGVMGRLSALVDRILPAPQPSALPPALWGDEAYVLALLGDRVTSVGASRQRHDVDRFSNPQEFRDFVRHGYEPTSAAYRKVKGHPDRVAELDHAVVDLARDHMTRGGRMQWEYLLLTAHRTG